ncbi:hypothetical protein GEV33_013766 [Tenebrio molitor]|uniref:Uncharacterized protein n=1 Tax=Tenebrio molitor TaxID=7067 RepID=A0A8J6H6J4_TENMO|nr:hypothetical protein GEV33_013766 [Tenebrio molitor]
MVEDGVCYKMGHGEVSECVTEPAPGPALSLRPRGGLARALYEKHQTDQFLSQFDKSQLTVEATRGLLGEPEVGAGPLVIAILFLPESKRGDVAVETMFFEKSKVMLKVQVSLFGPTVRTNTVSCREPVYEPSPRCANLRLRTFPFSNPLSGVECIARRHAPLQHIVPPDNVFVSGKSATTDQENAYIP